MRRMTWCRSGDGSSPTSEDGDPSSLRAAKTSTHGPVILRAAKRSRRIHPRADAPRRVDPATARRMTLGGATRQPHVTRGAKPPDGASRAAPCHQAARRAPTVSSLRAAKRSRRIHPRADASRRVDPATARRMTLGGAMRQPHVTRGANLPGGASRGAPRRPAACHAQRPPCHPARSEAESQDPPPRQRIPLRMRAGGHPRASRRCPRCAGRARACP